YYFSSLQQYKEYANLSKLLPLETRLHNDSFYLDDVPDFVANILRENDFNQMYGLAPAFHSMALFYNKKIFEDYGIEPPRNFMSWEEVWQLSERLPPDIMALQIAHRKDVAFTLVEEIGETEGLHYIHPNTYELDMNRPEWREIVGDVVAAVQRGDLYYIKS